MAIWDAVKELEGLQRKAAKGKDIEDKDTFVVRAALKERGWDGHVCEEAISRGYKEHRGEMLDFPSWYLTDDILSTPCEVQGSETPEEDQSIPGRVFNLLGDMGGEESQEQEGVQAELLARKQKAIEKEFDKIFGPTKKKEETMEQPYKETGLPSMADYDMAKKEQDRQALTDIRRRVLVGEEIGWLCEHCNTVWGLDEVRCPACPKAEPPTVEHRGWGDANLLIGTDVLREHMAKHLEKKKDDKDLAIEAMHKALGMETLEIDIPDKEDRDGCGHCGADDYLECDCCLECEAETCVCCLNCARFPCQCGTEECPICHNNIVIGAACPHGCDSDITELQTLYEDVKNSKDLDFGEKVKFMSLLKEKMGLAHDDPDHADINVTQDEEGEWIEDDPEQENE